MLCVKVFRGGDVIEVSRVELGRALSAWLAFVLAIALMSLIGFGLSFGLLTAFLILVYMVLALASHWRGPGLCGSVSSGFFCCFGSFFTRRTLGFLKEDWRLPWKHWVT